MFITVTFILGMLSFTGLVWQFLNGPQEDGKDMKRVSILLWCFFLTFFFLFLSAFVASIKEAI